MECLVEARTEGAGVCVFDAACLPPEADHAAGEAATQLRDALSKAGKAWFARTPGNGTWPVRIRIDAAGAGDGAPVHRGRLAVPSGKLWVCGAEFLALDPAAGSTRTPEGGLGRHPMGGCIDVPAGVYELSVYAHDAVSAVPATTAAGAATAAAAAAAVPSATAATATANATVATGPSAAAPRSRRRQIAHALEFGGYLAGGIGIASAGWTLYALWLGDTDETWQHVLRQNVPAILAFLVVGWAMLYVARMLEGFESARELAAPAPVAGPAYTLVLSRIGGTDPHGAAPAPDGGR